MLWNQNTIRRLEQAAADDAAGVNLATSAETIAGTLTTKAVTPDGLEAANPAIDPRKHGLVAYPNPGYTDGVANSAALQAAIDEACGTGDPIATTRSASRRVEIPAGIYFLANQINIRSVVGFEMVGVGNVELRAVANMTSVLDINGAAYSKFGGFWITGTAGVQVDNAIYTYWDSAGSARSNTENSYSNIVIGNLDYIVGIRTGKPGVGGVQVDNDEYRHITIKGGWTTGEAARWQQGLYLGNGTAGNNLLHHVYAVDIITNRYNIYVDQSQVDLYGAGLGNAEIDIFTGITGYISIAGVRSETSERFLKTGGPTTAAPMISMTDILWSANGLNADGVWLNIAVGGVVAARNVVLSNLSVAPKVTLGAGVTAVKVLFDGLRLTGTVAPVTLESMFTFSSAATASVRGYTATNSGGSVQYVHDWEGPSTNAQTGTTYTFVQRDATVGAITFSNAGAITATIPPNSSVVFPIGARLLGMQIGAGALTFQGGAGVTVNGVVTGTFASPAQYRQITAVKTATDTWVAWA